MSVEFFDKTIVAKSFGKAAEHYDSVAHFQRWVGGELLKKIPNSSVQSDKFNILDLGCGTGYFSPALLNHSPSGSYFGLDLSVDMVKFARQSHSYERCTWLTGDAESIPLKTNSVDLVYSSLSIQWCGDLGSMFEEVTRVLRDDGVFVFSSLLEGSLSELKASWSAVDSMQHVNAFSKLDDYQAAIQESGLQVVALDVEQKVLKYKKVKELTKELKTLGAHNMTSHRSTALTGKQKIKGFLSAYECFRLEDGTLPATYQVLWGVLRKSL